MVIHVNKSSLSYQEICQHYIEASDSTPIADRNRRFYNRGGTSISPAPYFDCENLRMLTNHVNNVTSEIHEFKCTKEDKSIDQSKCVIILVYNGLNYYAATLLPSLRDLYYKKNQPRKNQ